MYILMLDDRFISEQLVFNSLVDLKEYLTDILGNTTTVHTQIFDNSSAYTETKLTNTRELAIDDLIKELCANQEHNLVIEDTMFAPYHVGRLDIIKLEVYNSLK